MSGSNGKKPSAGDVAGIIGATVYNAGKTTTITNAEIKVVANRDKLREGLRKPIIDALQRSGYAVVAATDAITVSPPPETERPLSFSEARADSEEAVKNGMRQHPSGGVSSDVMKPDGSGFL